MPCRGVRVDGVVGMMDHRAESELETRDSIQNPKGGSIPASALYFHLGRREEADALVMMYHYSRRIPSNVQLVATAHVNGGLFGTCGDVVAACYFSIPPTRWSEDVFELSRLVRIPNNRVPMTALIAFACRELRKKIDLVVSFADETQSHKGYVYRAASWNYSGKREPRMDGLIIEGTFKPGRSCNSVYGTRSASRLKDSHGIEAEPHYDEGKHLYWRALSKSGLNKAVRLQLKSVGWKS